MAEISKLSGVAIADVAKVDAVTKADIANINDLTLPSAAAFLLDTYTGAAAAYSTRRLYSLYTGAAMRVREDSGDTETDIGFDSNGDLDTAAIATHCGSANGYVTKWYDQSTAGGTGSGTDAEQTTNGSQPQIYNGTAVITENGKPAVEFDGLDDMLTAGSYNESTATSIVVQVNDTVSGNDRAFSIKGSTATGKNTFGQANDLTLRYDGAFSNGSQTAAIDTQYLRFAVRSTSSQTEHVNGASNASTSLTLPNMIGSISIGNAHQTFNIYDGRVQEAILYSSDQTSNRSGIESDINAYFSIY